MSLTVSTAECSSSALFRRPELSIVPPPGPAETLEGPIEWTKLPREHTPRPVARLATLAPGSGAESGLIELGAWAGGIAANGPGPDPLRPSIMAPAVDHSGSSGDRDAESSGSGSRQAPAILCGMDPVGLVLFTMSFTVLTIAAALLASTAFV